MLDAWAGSKPVQEEGAACVEIKSLPAPTAVLAARASLPGASIPLSCHSSSRTTETYYARYSPEFAIARARQVVENREQMGDADPEQTPFKKASQTASRKVLNFNEFKRRVGGGDRTRTGE